MRVAVIGAGIGGLVAAYRLVQAGHDVRVLEAAPQPGGVLGGPRDAGWLVEQAAGSFLGDAADGAVALCDELGVATVAAAATARRRWVFIDGKLQAVPDGPLALLRSDLLTWRGKLDLLREPLRAGGAGRPDESVHAFAVRRLGPEAARALVAPMVTGIFAARAHDVGLAAGFPKLAALDADGGLLRGGLKAMRRRRAAGGAPARRGLFAPVDGVGAIVDALVAQLGGRLRCGAAVRHVRRIDRGDAVELELASEVLQVDAAVLAVPARVAAGMVVGAPELATQLGALTRAPAAVVHLGYGGPVAAAAEGFGALIADGEAPRVLGIIFESSLWPGRAPAGHTLLRLVYGGQRDPDAVGLDDASLLAQAERDVALVLGERAVPVRRGVTRWRDGIAGMPVGHAARLEALRRAAAPQRLVLAGAGYHGVAVNDLCADGRRVVADVARLA